MKRKLYKILSLFLGILCLVFIIKIINLIYNQNGLIENTYSNDYVVNKNDNLSMMLETEYDSNQYELATSSEWPTDGYIFNEELSACKNGSKVSWDSDTNRVVVYAGSIDSCYIYFDKELDTIYLADYIKNEVYTGVDGENDLYYHDGVGSYTNAVQETGDYSYRYSGADPNNYVCFAIDVETCLEDNLYRIIGVFGENVKLIKNDYVNSVALGTNGDYYNSSYSGTNNASSYYEGSLNQAIVPVYSWNQAGSNTWSASELNTVNLNINYLNYLNGIDSKWNDMIETMNWQVGGNTDDKIHEVSVKNTYQNEIISPAANTLYSAKIGLMYVSDYGYAISPENWGTKLSSYNTATTRNNNWMFMGLGEWTITRQSGTSNRAIYLTTSGAIGNGYVHIDYGHRAIRPTFYLKSNVAITSGDGSSSNPYRLSIA